MADVMGAIADAVFQQRTRLGMSQRELAERAQVSRHTVVNIENNKAEGVKMNTLSQILGVLGLEVRLGPAIAERPYPSEDTLRERSAFRRRFQIGGVNDYGLLTPREQ